MNKIKKEYAKFKENKIKYIKIKRHGITGLIDKPLSIFRGKKTVIVSSLILYYLYLYRDGLSLEFKFSWCATIALVLTFRECLDKIRVLLAVIISKLRQ